MAKVTWTGGSSNSFNDRKNWSPQTVPGATSDVVIVPATATSIVAANDTINSLTTNANTTLSVTATNTFTIIDKITTQNPTGTSINGGTLVLGSAADLFLSGTFENTGVLTTQSASDVWVTGPVVNAGTINQQGDVNVGNATMAGAIVETAGAHWTITGNVDVTGGSAPDRACTTRAVSSVPAPGSPMSASPPSIAATSRSAPGGWSFCVRSPTRARCRQPGRELHFGSTVQFPAPAI